MAFPLTFPTNVFPARVRPVRRTAAGVHESPFTFQQQVYEHPGNRWEIEVTSQELSAADAAVWTQFFYDLRGRVGTFTMNLNAHCPGLDPAPGEVTFRLAESDIGWDSELATVFRFTFRAVEAL